MPSGSGGLAVAEHAAVLAHGHPVRDSDGPPQGVAVGACALRELSVGERQGPFGDPMAARAVRGAVLDAVRHGGGAGLGRRRLRGSRGDAQAKARAAATNSSTIRPTTAETTLCVTTSPHTISKRSVWTRSTGTPIAGRAASIASISAFGPQMKYWKCTSSFSGRCRRRTSALM